MVFHEEPIAHVGPIAIKRYRLARHRLKDHHRDQLLGELPGAVIVGAVGEHHRQAVGVVPGAHQMVAGGLAGRIGRAGVVGGGFTEAARFAQGTKHLIGTDVVKAKTLAPFTSQSIPMGPYRLEQVERARHIALNEGPWAID